ncbi:MAG: DUF3299 domain-containing protein, partial [Planctomycetes bacterium]|nr:DUF3299 domain-containing protein [Planctomycetota bacterium]
PPPPAAAPRGTEIDAPAPSVPAQLPPGHHNVPAAGGDPFAGLRLDGEGPHRVGWDVLSAYLYTREKPPVPGADETALGAIPDAIRCLSGKRITVTGYQMPLEMRGETNDIEELLLLRNPYQCCFGVAPRPNEWIVARVAPGASVESGPIVVTLTGVLEVGEEYREGELASVYRMKEAAPVKGGER